MDRLTPGTIKPVELDKIQIDEGTQMRTRIDDDTVNDYRMKYEAGIELPPATVYFDGSAYWLADGYHRYHAKKRTGAAVMACDVRPGERRDAVLHAVGANAEHGRPRSAGDKRRAVETLLKDAEWAKWSDREIARRAMVAPTYVGTIRGQLAAAGGDASVHSGQMRTVERGGKTYTQDTAAIGRGKAAAAPGGTAATDDVVTFDYKHFGTMHGPGDDLDTPRDVAADVARRNAAVPTEAKADAAYAAARLAWQKRVRELVYELVQQDDSGCRLLAMIGLDLGDVGQTLGEFDCDTAEAGDRVVNKLLGDQVREAIDCDKLKPGPLIRRLLGDPVGQVLALFSDDNFSDALIPLFVALAEGWGAIVPAEPKPGDFATKPKPAVASKPSEYQQRVLNAVAKLVGGNDGRTTFELILGLLKKDCSTTKKAAVRSALGSLSKGGHLYRSMAGFYILTPPDTTTLAEGSAS